MSIKTHNFRIGLFVLAGALLLVVALLAMGAAVTGALLPASWAAQRSVVGTLRAE